MATEIEEPITRIMVAVNQSSVNGYPYASISSEEAFDWTVKKIIRSNTSGFKLLLLHVQSPDEYGRKLVDNIYASPGDFKSIKHGDKIRGVHLLEYFVNQCHELGIACEAWIKEGEPKDVICYEVARVHPDFLVVGNRGLNSFTKIFVRNVSEFCTKNAACPVIAIKRPAAQAPEDPIDD